ncbi:hypothetical protein [Actinobacillus seminis]|nr:hypothetical protein [Actinobacillus seminis]
MKTEGRYEKAFECIDEVKQEIHNDVRCYNA